MKTKHSFYFFLLVFLTTLNFAGTRNKDKEKKPKHQSINFKKSKTQYKIIEFEMPKPNEEKKDIEEKYMKYNKKKSTTRIVKKSQKKQDEKYFKIFCFNVKKWPKQSTKNPQNNQPATNNNQEHRNKIKKLEKQLEKIKVKNLLN